MLFKKVILIKNSLLSGYQKLRQIIGRTLFKQIRSLVGKGLLYEKG